MGWLLAPSYGLARLLVQRGVGVLYFIAFAVALNQFRPLCGERGLLPVPRYLSFLRFREAPSLFHWRYSDRLLAGVSWTGVALSVSVVLGLPDHAPLWVGMAIFFVLWALYLSIVNVGQTFYAFGWESLQLELGFLAIFLGRPTWPAVYLLRWLLFRLEFGAGLIKMRGDPCWRKLTCLYYHHETQPMPNPLSWLFHHLPKPLHRVEVLGNHVAQLLMPVGLFLPQPVADVAAAAMVITQGWLVLSGNFAWLNLATIVIALGSFDDRLLVRFLPFHAPAASVPVWFGVVLLAFTGAVLVMSWWPARNLVSPGQLMNYSFNPFHLVNSYGAFGSVTKVRHEVVIEGTRSPSPLGAEWLEYGFKGKPGDPRRRPPQIAPYHLRLDWLMWFAAMSSPHRHGWFVPLLVKLLENDRATLALLRENPFPGEPPTFVRARLYRYRFTTPAERRASGAYWSRELVGEYFPPLRRAADAAGAAAGWAVLD